jgi:hypothetical protein
MEIELHAFISLETDTDEQAIFLLHCLEERLIG